MLDTEKLLIRGQEQTFVGATVSSDQLPRVNLLKRLVKMLQLGENMALLWCQLPAIKDCELWYLLKANSARKGRLPSTSTSRSPPLTMAARPVGAAA